MSKNVAELAAEITVAWLQAFSGQREAPATVANILTPTKVAEMYRTIFRTINEEMRGPDSAHR